MCRSVLFTMGHHQTIKNNQIREKWCHQNKTVVYGSILVTSLKACPYFDSFRNIRKLLVGKVTSFAKWRHSQFLKGIFPKFYSESCTVGCCDSPMSTSEDRRMWLVGPPAPRSPPHHPPVLCFGAAKVDSTYAVSPALFRTWTKYGRNPVRRGFISENKKNKSGQWRHLSDLMFGCRKKHALGFTPCWPWGTMVTTHRARPLKPLAMSPTWSVERSIPSTSVLSTHTAIATTAIPLNWSQVQQLYITCVINIKLLLDIIPCCSAILL